MWKGYATRAAVAAGAALAVASTDARFRAAVAQRADGVTRFARTSYHAAVVAIDYKRTGRLLGAPEGMDERSDEYRALKKMEPYASEQARTHHRAAQRMLTVCLAHGGVFTKFGQYVASLNHVLPTEYTTTLARLQDHAQGMPYEDVRCVIEEELGAPLESAFASFGREPIACASLAQVHHATTVDGREVAVKVQYRGLKAKTAADMWTMSTLARVLAYLFPTFDYVWMLPEFEDNLRLELDFRQEGRNGDRVRAMFADREDVHVPAVHWDLTSERLLVMEFVHGVKVNDKEALQGQLGVPPAEVAAKVSTVFGDMVMVHGFVHADPHPGNLLVRRVAERSPPWYRRRAPRQVTQLVVLDHGMYRRLTPEFRRSYCLLWKAMVLQDPELLRVAARQLRVGKWADFLPVIFTYRTMSSTAGLGGRMNKKELQQLKDMAKGITLADVNSFMERLPRDMLFVMRSTNLVRSLNMQLGGSSRERFRLTGESALRGLLLSDSLEATARGARAASAALAGSGSGSASGSDAATERVSGVRGGGTGNGKGGAADGDGEAPGMVGDAEDEQGAVGLLAPHMINDPVESESQAGRGSLASLGLWWQLQRVQLRLRLWVVDTFFALAWWYRSLRPHTDQDVG